MEEVFLPRIVYWTTLHWVESKHKRNPSSLWNPGHRHTNWRKITSFVNGNLHTLPQWWICLWPLGGDNVLAGSTNSYSSTTPSRPGSQTATKPVVGAECRFKVDGLCQPTMSCSQAYQQGPHYVKGILAVLEGWQLWISIILLCVLLQVNLVISIISMIH